MLKFVVEEQEDIKPGALLFLPALFRGFLTTYQKTSSSLETLKSLGILLVLLGPGNKAQ